MLPAFVCAYNTGSLVDNLFGVNIFNSFPSFTSSSSPSSGGISGISLKSSELSVKGDGVTNKSLLFAFCLFNSALQQ